MLGGRDRRQGHFTFILHRPFFEGALPTQYLARLAMASEISGSHDVPLLETYVHGSSGGGVEITCKILDAAELLTVDETLQYWVGEFGPAQLLHFTLASFAWATAALHTLVTIFADKTPPWKCSDLNPIGSSSYSDSSPLHASISYFFWRNSGGSLVESPLTCTPTSSICSMDSSLWEWVGGSSQSTVSQWGLVCENSYKVNLVQSVFFIGSLIGAGLFGSLSDSFLGRKRSLVLASFLSAVSSLLVAISPSYWIYLLLRAITGISNGGTGSAGFLLSTEVIGPSRRGAVGMSAFYFYSGGIMMLSGLAYVSRSSWRYIYLINSSASIVYCFITLLFLSESPRWYLVRGRGDEALSILKKFATRNGRSIPERVALKTEKECDESSNGSGDKHLVPQVHSGTIPAADQRSDGTLLDVFKTSSTRITMIIMIFSWFASNILYFGICLNVSNLGVNLYTAIILNAAAEIPGLIISTALLAKLGRRPTLCVAFVFGGMCCLIGALVLENEGDSSDLASFLRTVRLGCGMLGMVGAAGAYNVLYVYTAELFPTVVRNAAIGLTSQAAYVGAVVTPYIVALGHINPSFSSGIFGVVAVVAGLLGLNLAETSNRPLYDTL